MAAAKPATTARPVPQPARPAPTGASKTGDTVTVACKLPMGIIIRGFSKDTRSTPVLGGGQRDETYYREDGRVVRIIGNARPVGGNFRTRVVGGYALTQGVPKDLWEEWLHANRALPAVVNRLIFACPTIEDAAQESRDNRKTKSGLEPINPDGDPRRPQRNPLTPEIGDVTLDTEKMKAEAFETIDEDA